MGGWGGVEGVGGGLYPPGDTLGLAVGQRRQHMSPIAHPRAKEAARVGYRTMRSYWCSPLALKSLS